MSSAYVSSDEIRDQFSSAMSAMYQQEVPQYGTLLSLVEAVNREVLAANTELNGTPRHFVRSPIVRSSVIPFASLPLYCALS